MITTPRWVAGNPATTPPQPFTTEALRYADEQAEKRQRGAQQRRDREVQAREDAELQRIIAKYTGRKAGR